MKKLFKTAMLAVAVMAAGYGGYKTYSTYNGGDNNQLRLENIEAFSYELAEVTVICDKEEGRCWKRNSYPSWSWVWRKWGKCCSRSGDQSDFCYGVE